MVIMQHGFCVLVIVYYVCTLLIIVIRPSYCLSLWTVGSNLFFVYMEVREIIYNAFTCVPVHRCFSRHVECLKTVEWCLGIVAQWSSSSLDFSPSAGMPQQP